MKNRNAFCIAALFAVAALAVIASAPARADTLDFSKEVHVAVLLTTDAHLVLDGKPATLQDVERAIDDIASKGGVFWYARENGQSDPSPEQWQMFQTLIGYVMKRQLPIRMFTDGTFKTIVDD
jgi:hypothetical protein